jgi:hypothetical protein
LSTATKNLLPPLTDEEYAALEASILEHGYWSAYPVALDEDGEVLDGFNRKSICEKHGIKYPTITVKGLSAVEKATFAIKSNTTRRQLSTAQRRQVLKRLIEIHEADLKEQARQAQSEGGKKGAAKKASLTETTSDARARTAAAEASETRFDAPVVAPSKPKVDKLETYGNLLGVSRATAARDQAALEREERIETEAERQKRDDVIRALNQPRPNLDALEREVGLRPPLPDPEAGATEAERRGWVDALATALNHLVPALSDDEADLLVSKVTDPSMIVIQLGQLRGAVAGAKQRKGKG